jgi:hypothetical protein
MKRSGEVRKRSMLVEGALKMMVDGGGESKRAKRDGWQPCPHGTRLLDGPAMGGGPNRVGGMGGMVV